jgi:hypothetical protein
MAVGLHITIRGAIAIASLKGKHNETKALALQSILAVTENWAKVCQVPLHFLCARTISRFDDGEAR